MYFHVQRKHRQRFLQYYLTTMKTVYLCLVVALSVLCCCWCHKVIELDASTFQKTIAENSMVLVDFYAPWCGHCKTLRPILDRVAAQLTEQHIPCLIVAFDASSEENEVFLQNEQIDLVGFPSLILFKYGQKLSEYTGNRVESDLLAFLRSKSLPVATRIESYSEIEPLILSLEHNKYNQASKNGGAVINDVVNNRDNHILAIVLGLFPASSSSDVASSSNNSNLFMNIAMHFDLGLFFVSDNVELLSQFGIVEDSIVVFTSDKQHFKQRIIPFVDKTSYNLCVSQIKSSDLEGAVGLERSCQTASIVSEESIKRQILLECLPTVIPYSRETQPLISALPTKEHVLLFFNKSLERHVTFADQIESIERIHASNLLCIEVDIAEYQLFSFFNIRMDDLPQLVIVNMTDESDMKKYALAPYLQALHSVETDASGTTSKKATPVQPSATSHLILAATRDEIEGFIDQYVAHQLERSLLSEDVSALTAMNANMVHTHVENIASKNFKEKCA